MSGMRQGGEGLGRYAVVQGLWTWVLTACMLIMASPRSAHACVWNVLHWFNPLPPCEVEDQLGRYRNRQEAIRVEGKLGTLALHVREIRTELEAWRAAYRTARRFSEELTRVYGDLISDPIPSLLARYERTPLARFVRINPNGTFATVPLDSLAPALDFRTTADSVWQQFSDSLTMPRRYRRFAQAATDVPRMIYGTGMELERELAALHDFGTFTRPILDSLAEVGARTATRYVARGDVTGLSEARISQVSAVLSRLRGTAFEAQARGVSAKLQALTAVAERQRMAERAANRNSALQRF